MSSSLLEKMNTRVVKWMKLSCEQTSPLISESLDHPLSTCQKMRLRMHLIMCGVCKCYLQQLKTLGGLAQCLGQEDTPVLKNEVLRPDFKEQLKKTLKS